MRMSDDPYLHRVVDSLCDTPMQRRLRALAPLPIGVVVWQRIGDTLDDLRREFRLIHDHGFPALKQFVLAGDTPIALMDAELAALDAGIIPRHYGIGGWEPISAELLEQLGIDVTLPPDAIQRHPTMIAYQTDVLRRRYRRTDVPPRPEGLGEPPRGGAALRDELLPAFALWLEQTYGAVERALAVYHMRQEHEDAPDIATFADLAALSGVTRVGHPQRQGWAGFRQKRDVLRFLADHMGAKIRVYADVMQAWDGYEPVRTGNHQFLENQAANGWDFELQARAVSHAGSFYGSFHPTHHLAPVDGELDRPCYMTARIVADMNKGGWSAMWESVGGPQTYSGYYGYQIDARALERCMLSYLAAGLKGVGLWSWNPRDKGWEIGEYALCDLDGTPSERAQTAGAIARACERWRFELWQARDEPQVGVLYSWENEAAFARMSYGGYPLERLESHAQLPVQARIGAMRALINGHIPFELVTERNLRDGLAARYQAIFVPHTICLDGAILRILRAYVEGGGHLVVDSPSLLIRAEDGSLFDTRPGSDFERIFGLSIAAIQGTHNSQPHFRGIPVTGLTSDIRISSATVTDWLDDGRPAVAHHIAGRGTATFITFDVSSLCRRPGNLAMEVFLARLLLNGAAAPLDIDCPALVYRRAAPAADHLFVINDTADRYTARLTVRNQQYISAVDCISGIPVPLADGSISIELAPWQGRWIRANADAPTSLPFSPGAL
jgi:beta-galactosidase